MKQTLVKILKLVSPYKWWMLLASIIGFLTIGSSIGLLMTSAYIIAKAALHPHIGELQVGIVGVRFFGLSRGLLRYSERLFSHEVTFNLLAKFRVWFFQSIEPLVPAKMGKYNSADLLTRVVSDVESLEHIFIRVISPPIIAILVAVLVSVLFSFYSMLLVVAFLVPYTIAGVLIPLATYRLSRQYGEEIILLRSKLAEITIDGIDGRNEIIAFGKIDSHSESFNSTNQRLIKVQRRMNLISGLNESLIGLLMNFAILSVFLTAVPLIYSGNISGISLSVITLGTMAAFEAVLPIPLAVQYLNNSIKAGDRLFQITDKSVVEKESLEQQLVAERIELKDVVFGYNENKNVLKEISIKLKSKEKIAIIGGSGAGKSSIINLLQNFWDVNSGSISIDNIDYEKLSEEEIRANYSTIPQKVFLFSDTLKGNLLVAKPDATEHELWNSIEKAELRDFVESLPNKLNTWIGNQGKQLSGGERKRLAIARAILMNTEIFICDEITADLDSVNERNIIRTIHSVTKEKSLLFITHRLVDMEKYDSIYLLENGKIIGKGDHYELLTSSNKYEEYFH